MKFTCYKSDLNEALQFAVRAVAVKPMTPILTGIYMRAEGSVLEIHSNNFATGIIVRIPVNTEIPGEVVVNGKKLHEFVRSIPGETLVLSDEIDSSVLKIDASSAGVELLTMSCSDFPKVKYSEGENSFQIRTKTLRDLIRKTVFAVAKEDSRPVFTGCSFELAKDRILMVATNTHRLALASELLPETYPSCSFIVPAESLRGLLARISPDDVDNQVTVSYSTRYLMFSFDNVFVSSRLIEGMFPPYDRVIPSTNTTLVTVDTAEFKAAVDFVALMSKETEYNTVKFTFGDNNIEVSSASPEIGGAVKHVKAEIDGEDLEISFNVNYIADVMRVIDSQKVNIGLTNRLSPAVFTEPDNDGYVYVATPVRA